VPDVEPDGAGLGSGLEGAESSPSQILALSSVQLYTDSAVYAVVDKNSAIINKVKRFILVSFFAVYYN
jgi:hypothetical protein